MHNKKTSLSLVLILSFSALLSGCQSWFGPSALNETHPAYNQAIVNSLSEEMLLNLVRLKYRDRPYFLSIDSVTASMSLGANLGISGGEYVEPSAGVSFSQNPTISYTPLSGENFLRNVLSPIPLEAILIMANSGWHPERILGMCIERINGLRNAPSASGPTPRMEPEYKDFKQFIKSLTYLRDNSLIEIGANIDTSKRIKIYFLPTQEPQALAEMNTIRTLLKLKDSNNYLISNSTLANKANSWRFSLRSIHSIMYYLSQNISVPDAHKNLGLVTNTVTKQGDFFDWNETPAGMVFKVMSSADKPNNAYLSVPYRGYWFYIADNDLNSKSTFMLLNHLFTLQAGQSQTEGPVLTLPVSR
ncbi:MAG: hypothetical protein RQ733_07960 [Methyloprofundus sp.]|nr:hypothetical protein [Methyloprofundus sp.]